MTSNSKNQIKGVATLDGASIPRMMKVTSSVPNEGKYGATTPKMQSIPAPIASSPPANSDSSSGSKPSK